MRLFKEDTLCIRINPLLKDKFHIATWFAGISATLNTFIANYVRDYEKQYWIIPLTLKSKDKYDLITKFFWVKVNKKLYNEYNLEDTLKTINDLLWTDITYEEMKFFIDNYPKSRKENIHLPFTSHDERIDL